MQRKNVISMLEQMMPFLSATDKKIGSFVLDHKQEVLTLTLKEISAQAGVSEATVIRFARKLGCDGYAGFKLALSASLSANSHDDRSDTIMKSILKTDSPFTVLKKLSTLTVNSIQSTIDVIDPQELVRAVKLIRETNSTGHQIYLSGMGASSGPVKEMVIKFMRLGIPVIYHEDVHIQLESNLNMAEGDLLICFTTLGRSVQSHEYIDIANTKKAKVILITQFGNRELEQKVTVTLSLAAIENDRRMASQTAVIVQSLIVDVLFTSLAMEQLPKLQDKIEEKNKVFEDLGYIVTDQYLR